MHKCNRFLNILKALSIFGDAFCRRVFSLFKAILEFHARDIPQNSFGILLDSSNVFEPLTFEHNFENWKQLKIGWRQVRWVASMFKSGAEAHEHWVLYRYTRERCYGAKSNLVSKDVVFSDTKHL